MSNNGISNTAQAYLMLISLILIGIGAMVAAVPSQIPQPLNAYIGFALILIGAIGAAIKEWLGTLPTPSTTGLSNSAQAAFMLAAFILVGLGTMVAAVPSQIPSPLNVYIGFALVIAGAIGAAIKEWLGTLPTPTPATPPAAATAHAT
jgi:hypothetical protein